ncbi:noggin-like [Corythoichthys intestinalis]|uniref:noggin-like n=1 Tax=Corythoichthys intestinalis TaxID=161448 RepID=UPI0025A668EF|nr:noggin-like [Corythoichthys intestinalis]
MNRHIHQVKRESATRRWEWVLCSSSSLDMSLGVACACVLLLACVSERADCQHYYLLRPVPSDGLPLTDLREDPDPALDPRERDLNETELRVLLGDLDDRFLALSLPEGAAESSPSPLDVAVKPKRRLRQWLRAYTSCPLTTAWSDLGARFWPRYVRAGGCPAERSCSLPEGMRCRPAASAHLTVLRWRCVHRKAGLKCAWIPVRYPVITRCQCACD